PDLLIRSPSLQRSPLTRDAAPFWTACAARARSCNVARACGMHIDGWYVGGGIETLQRSPRMRDAAGAPYKPCRDRQACNVARARGMQLDQVGNHGQAEQPAQCGMQRATLGSTRTTLSACNVARACGMQQCAVVIEIAADDPAT